MSPDAIVDDTLEQVLREMGKSAPALTDDLRLEADLGLSSLDVTTVLTRLTARVDTRRAELMMSGSDLATIGDLRSAFRAACNGAVRGEHEDLAASRRRAEARRAARR